MKNNLSVDEIKNSVEYQWRKHHIKINLYIWLLISCITLFIPFVLALENFEYIGTGLLVWIGFVGFYGLIIGAFILYYVLMKCYWINCPHLLHIKELFIIRLMLMADKLIRTHIFQICFYQNFPLKILIIKKY